MKRILIVICCILFTSSYDYILLGQGTASLPSKNLEDFEDEKNRDFKLVGVALDSTPLEISAQIKAKHKLKILWEKDLTGFGGDQINRRIDTLFAELKSWAKDCLSEQVSTSSVENFAKKYNLGWCTKDSGSLTNKSANEPCRVVDENNFNIFRYHLIYSFARVQIDNLNNSSTSPNPGSAIEELLLELEKKAKELDKTIRKVTFEMLIALIIIALLLLGAIILAIFNWSKIRNSAKKIDKLAKNKSDQLSVIGADLNRNGNKTPSEPINQPAQEQDQVMLSSPSINSNNESTDERYRSSEEKKENNKENPILPPKVTLFTEIPNPQGVMAKIHKVENKKSYFKLLLPEEDSTRGEITLVDNREKRNRAFNAPNTFLPPSICSRRYPGQIDYSSRVHIEPGEVKKLSNGNAWEVTSPITITLR